MLILPQMVEVTLSPANLKHFEEKGYEIPRYYNEHNRRILVKKGSKIIVKVEDLQLNSNVYVDVKCDYCGKIIPRKFCDYNNKSKNITNKDCCFECRGNKITESKIKYSYEDMINEFTKFNYIPLISSDDFVDSQTLIEYICPEGHNGGTSLSHFVNGRRCKTCAHITLSNSQRFTYSYVKHYFEINNCELLSNDYENELQLLDYICLCGNPSKITFKAFKKGSRCKKCRTKKVADIRRLPYDSVWQIFNNAGCTLLSKEYKNNSEKMDYICECGNPDTIDLVHFLRGQRCKKCAKKKRSIAFSGSKSNFWRGGVTSLNLIVRSSAKYRDWRNNVFKRDNYTCQCCGKRGGKLEVHHKDGFHWNKNRRLDVSNGVTLCKDCHKAFHVIFGNSNNTEDQFNQWIKEKTILIQTITEVEKTSVLLL